MKTGLILLAGGLGTRMGGIIPKQFLLLNDKPIAHYSLDVFQAIEAISEIVVVVDSSYSHLFPGLKQAPPGKLRQDSVWSGLNALSEEIEMVLIHDAARPFINPVMVSTLLAKAKGFGAAAIGVPMCATVKEVDVNLEVVKTLDRSKLWEIQTPQAIKKDLLMAGFSYANTHHLTVTDDVSLVELLGYPVHMVMGNYVNFKITNPEDLKLAQLIVQGSS